MVKRKGGDLDLTHDPKRPANVSHGELRDLRKDRMSLNETTKKLSRMEAARSQVVTERDQLRQANETLTTGHAALQAQLATANSRVTELEQQGAPPDQTAHLTEQLRQAGERATEAERRRRERSTELENLRTEQRNAATDEAERTRRLNEEHQEALRGKDAAIGAATRERDDALTAANGRAAEITAMQAELENARTDRQTLIDERNAIRMELDRARNDPGVGSSGGAASGDPLAARLAALERIVQTGQGGLPPVVPGPQPGERDTYPVPVRITNFYDIPGMNIADAKNHLGVIVEDGPDQHVWLPAGTSIALARRFTMDVELPEGVPQAEEIRQALHQHPYVTEAVYPIYFRVHESAHNLAANLEQDGERLTVERRDATPPPDWVNSDVKEISHAKVRFKAETPEIAAKAMANFAWQDDHGVLHHAALELDGRQDFRQLPKAQRLRYHNPPGDRWMADGRRGVNSWAETRRPVLPARGDAVRHPYPETHRAVGR